MENISLNLILYKDKLQMANKEEAVLLTLFHKEMV